MHHGLSTLSVASEHIWHELVAARKRYQKPLSPICWGGIADVRTARRMMMQAELHNHRAPQWQTIEHGIICHRHPPYVMILHELTSTCSLYSVISMRWSKISQSLGPCSAPRSALTILSVMSPSPLDLRKISISSMALCSFYRNSLATLM